MNTLSYNDEQDVKSAKLSTTYTNHSLRTTSASHLFAKNVLEKIIQEMSGHRSAAGLHAYEHTTADQHHAVTRVLESANATFTAEDSLKNSTNDCPSMPVHKQDQPCQSNRKNVYPAPVFSGQVQNCVFNFYT